MSISDPDGDSVEEYLGQYPSHGQVDLLGDTAIYTPENYLGEDRFTVVADDRYGGEATASIRVQIWDTAPQASGLSISTDEDTSLEMTLRGSDPDDDPLQYIIISGPTHGSLSGTAPNMTYTPDPNYYGADSFSYKVSDTVLESAVATVTITVNPVNDLPVLESIPDKDVNEGGGLSFILSATDIDGDPLSYSMISGPGSISGDTYTYSAPWDENHLDETYAVTIQVTDGHGGTDAKSFQLTVHDINRPPSLEEILDQGVNEGDSLSFTVNATDPDNDPLSYAVISGPGSMVGFTYEYSADWDTDHVNETYSVTIQVSDSYGGTDTRSFAITVHDVNRPPTATPESVVADEDTPVDITLIGSDPDGDPLTFSIVSEPTNGSLSGTLPNAAYTPNPDYNGSDSFTFQVADGYGGTATATVSITVNPVNDPPVAVDDYAITEEDASVIIAVLANDSDPDGDILTIASVSMPWHGTATIIGDGVRYDPDPGYSGTDSFTYTISDGHGGTAGATVTVEVRHLNHPPVAYDDEYTVDWTAPVPITLRAYDPDGDPLSYIIVTRPRCTLTGTPPNLTWYPCGGPTFDEFTFKVNDGELDSNIATIVIDPPEEP